MTENIRQHVKSIVHDTRNRVNDDMKCVGKGLWHEDCIIHYRKTAKTAFLASYETLFLRPNPKERVRKQRSGGINNLFNATENGVSTVFILNLLSNYERN